jgi:hypothetical protein
VTQFPANLPNDFSSIQPASELVKLTKAQAFANGPCRGLLVGTAGTANVTDLAGNELANVPLQQGFNPICIQALAAGGTADDIWALYSAAG